MLGDCDSSDPSGRPVKLECPCGLWTGSAASCLMVEEPRPGPHFSTNSRGELLRLAGRDTAALSSTSESPATVTLIS